MDVVVTIVAALASILLLSWRRAWLSMAIVLWFVKPIGHMGIGHLAIPVIFTAVGLPWLIGDAKEWSQEKFFKLFLVVAGLDVLSAFWSPDPSSGPHEAVSVAVIAGLFLVTYVIVSKDRYSLNVALGWAAPFVLAQAVSTIYLNNSLAAKHTYYASGLAKLILGNVADAAVTGDAIINGIGRGKTAGILFTNGNRASMVMGVCGLVYLAFAIYAKKRWAYVVSLVSVAGVVASQSKSGIGLLIVTVAGAILLAGLANRVAGLSRLWGLFASLLGLAFLVATFRWWGREIAEKVDTALVPRTALWSTAWDSVVDNPLTGWGWGAWHEHWAPVAAAVGSRPSYPPHNSLLYAGTRGGLPLMIAEFLAAAALFFFAVRWMSHIESRRDRLALALVGAATVWSFAHGMGDNTLFYGTMNSVPFIAVGLALCMTIRAGLDLTNRPPTERIRRSERKYLAVERELVKAKEDREDRTARGRVGPGSA